MDHHVVAEHSRHGPEMMADQPCNNRIQGENDGHGLNQKTGHQRQSGTQFDDDGQSGRKGRYGRTCLHHIAYCSLKVGQLSPSHDKEQDGHQKAASKEEGITGKKGSEHWIIFQGGEELPER